MEKEETRAEHYDKRISEEMAAGHNDEAEALKGMMHTIFEMDIEMKKHVAALIEMFLNDISRSLVTNYEYSNFKFECRYGTGHEYITGRENINESYGRMENIEFDVTGLSVPEMAEHVIKEVVEGRWGRHD